jgi:hypothetical protein
VKRRTMQRGPGQQRVDGASFHLIDEVHYIQRRAAEQDSRVVTLPLWLLFSTQTGDAWLLEPGDHLAVPLARQGDPLPLYRGNGRHLHHCLAGNVPIEVKPSCTRNETQAMSAPSSATQYGT